MGVGFLEFFPTQLRKGYNVGANVVFTVVFFSIILILIIIAALRNRKEAPHVLRPGTVSGKDFSSLLLLFERTWVSTSTYRFCLQIGEF